MSGTSLDGVDIALCAIDSSSCKLVHSHEYPFPSDLREDILSAIAEPLILLALGTLEHKLGTLFGDSINTFLDTFSIKRADVRAIGLHGQTLWHQPDGEHPFSMQVGDANIVATKTQIQTIADFRRMDIANGGQGAPFAPAFHQFIFSDLAKNVGVLNIGGMANITF
ncbi:MAG: anhydro-N-acetylmuramic acid kinase [Sulfurimonas sp.]|nr:anhydro-N-acetylmuramic acid kinase [Sulfurimonas sp.]